MAARSGRPFPLHPAFASVRRGNLCHLQNRYAATPPRWGRSVEHGARLCARSMIDTSCVCPGPKGDGAIINGGATPMPFAFPVFGSMHN